MTLKTSWSRCKKRVTYLRINTNHKDIHRKYSYSPGIKEIQIKSNSEILFHIHYVSNVLSKYHQWYYHQWNITNTNQTVVKLAHILLLSIGTTLLQSNLVRTIQILIFWLKYFTSKNLNQKQNDKWTKMLNSYLQ